MNLAALYSSPDYETTPLVRTDFSDDLAWEAVVSAVYASEPARDEEPVGPNVEAVADRAFEGVTPESLVAACGDSAYGYLILADARSMLEAKAGGEVTVLYVDLSVQAEDREEFGWQLGQSFRCATGAVASIEVNLSLANVDFEEFADGVADDGVYREDQRAEALSPEAERERIYALQTPVRVKAPGNVILPGWTAEDGAPDGE